MVIWTLWFSILHLCVHINVLFSIGMLCLKPSLCLGNTGNETDRLALLEFKTNISDDPHGILNSWNDSTHFCTWQGVTCGHKHQRVTTLSLHGLSLLGTISPYIGNLTFLRNVSLGKNRFHGEVPAEVGRLFRLQVLNLPHNTLEGEIPVSISNCSELRVMNFDRNRLVGKIPNELNSLKKLVVLMLGINNITGEIPHSVGNISTLENFSLSSNNLKGSIPSQLGKLTSLFSFAVGINNLSGTIPSTLYNISSIGIFSIPQNQLTGRLPQNIGITLPNLGIFQIGMNNFYGTIPVSLFNASQLEYVDVANNLLEGKVPNNLGHLNFLEMLNLESNILGDNKTQDLSFITSLTNSSNLELVAFDNNNFGGVLPRSIGNLSTKLTDLFMGGNQLFGKIPEEVGNLVNLYRLHMEANYFYGSIPVSLGKLAKLQLLGLDANLLSGEIPPSIGNITYLYELQLSTNALEGNISSSILKCQHLHALDLSRNKLTGDFPQDIISLPSLSTVLNLSKNSFTGPLPFDVGKLKNINKLDVSENNLSGEIPETLGDCLMLESLHLQGNLFQGPIPSSFASLRGLQQLDLSRNNLSGNIPKEIEQFLFLQFLNLSFNNLEGEVPTKGVFSNVNAISLVGNTNLCGGIPELKLPECRVNQKKNRRSPIAIILATTIAPIVFFLMAVSAYVFYRQKSRKNLSFNPFTVNRLPRVSYQELLQATGGFNPSHLIGQGSSGSVYRARLEQLGEKLVAVKVLNLHQHGATKSFITECKALKNIRHRNLVKFLTYCSSIDFKGNDFKALVFDFMANGSLEMWLHPQDVNNQPRNLSLLQRLMIVADVSSALHYLHDNSDTPIIHCDLKPSNILLDDDMTAHIGDFGLARLLLSPNSSQGQTSSIGIKGTIGYMAPEYGVGSEVTTYGDVYSFGIILLEIFTGRRPTDEVFRDGLNLHNLVRANIPRRVMQVVDPMLITAGELGAAKTTEENDMDDAEIQEDNVNIEDLKLEGGNAQKCLVSVLKIGLACSSELPRNRMKMRDVTRKLNVITKAFLHVSTRRDQRNVASRLQK